MCELKGLSNELVADTLIEVFSYLDGKELLKCVEVCREWRFCIENSYLSKQTFYVKLNWLRSKMANSVHYVAEIKGLKALAVINKEVDRGTFGNLCFISSQECSVPSILTWVESPPEVAGCELKLTRIDFGEKTYGRSGQMLGPVKTITPIAKTVTFSSKAAITSLENYLDK